MSKQGLTLAMLSSSFPGGRHRDLLWYGGPITPEIPGGVLARYPDGTPAITQILSGNGFVIISGLHPALPRESITALGLEDSDGSDEDFAWQLLEAMIQKRPLQAF
jgi:hypothetical protein